MTGRVVVLGGGLAGLLAATALSRHCDDVTVVESDVLPDTAQPRRGLPQSRHDGRPLPGQPYGLATCARPAP